MTVATKPAARKFITLTEAVGASTQIDTAAGVIRNVKVLGRSSVNKRAYSESAVTRAVPLYEGKELYVNHPAKPGAARDYKDRGGVLRNAKVVEGEIFADLHYNPANPVQAQIAWDAEHAPNTFGLSHVADGVGSRGKDGVWLIEEITQVYSVDVVTRPATTKGIFESEGYMDGMDAAGAPVAEAPNVTDSVKASFKDAINAVVEGDGDDKDKLAKIKSLLKAQADAVAAVTDKPAEPATETPAEDKPEEKPVAESAELLQLRGEKAARLLLEAADVPVKAHLIEAIAALPDARRKAFVESIKSDLATAKPGARTRSAAPMMESAGVGSSPTVPTFAGNTARNGFLRS